MSWTDPNKMPKNPKIFITNPVTILKLLRNFGYTLRSVFINFNFFNVKFCAEIEFYLAEYCSESLHRLSLSCNSSKTDLFENLHKPLANVKELRFYTNLDQNLSPLQFNQEKLPRLKYVYIDNNCPELQHSDPMHFENVEYFTIATLTFRKFPFTFGKLKHLIFLGVSLKDEWCNFVGNMQHLTTLKMFNISSHPLLGKMLELQNLVSNIEELQLCLVETICSDDILRFLQNSRNLKSLTLVINRIGYGYKKTGIILASDSFIKDIEKIMEVILSNLDPKWKFRIIDPFRNPYQEDSLVTPYCYVIEKIIK